LADTNIWKEISALSSESFIEKEKTSFEVVLNKKDKSTCTAIAFVSPHDINNPEKGYTLSFLDISKTKRIQNELLQAKEKAEEADKLKNAFLLNMSHDIRTPLNAILGFTDLLTNNTISEEQKCEYASIIQSSGKKLLRMIDDIVDMSYINTDQVEIKRKMFPLHPLLSEIHSTFSDYINERCNAALSIGLAIPFSKEHDTVTVFNDDVRLKQVINGLIRNSLRYTKEGQIEFGYEITSENKTKFFVKDTGEGIKEDQLAYLFYNQKHISEESYTKVYGETSLGLTVIKRLIEMMGGEMWVESVFKKGTNIYFTLPGAVSEQARRTFTSVSPVKQITAHDWSHKTILVAEDEEMNYEFIRRLLSHTKVNITWAENGQKAIDYFNSDPNINLVLMDIKCLC
jgi:signal transduction histidine kinase